MWICLSDCFLSIVSKDCADDELLVRARRDGDIEKIFPDAKVFESPHNDYRYRAVLKRSAVADAMASEVDRIRYTNFKNTVADVSLHSAYANVWGVMGKLQRGGPYGSGRGGHGNGELL